MKSSKKVLRVSVIIVLIVILILGCIYIYNKKKISQKDYSLETIENYNYFILGKNDSVGIIDTKGNILIEPTYYKIQVPNPSKDVFICYTKLDTQNYNIKVFNKSNNQIFTQYDEVTPILIKSIISNVPYEKSVLVYKQNDKYGIIDFDGNKITEAIYDEISNVKNKEGELLVRQNDKFGVINIKGENLVDIAYDTIEGDSYCDENYSYKLSGYIIGQKLDDGYKYGYVNSKGKILLDTEYNEVYRFTELGDAENIYMVAFKNGQGALINNKKILTEFMYKEMEYNDTNELFVVSKAEKYGLLDIKGNTVLETEFEDIVFEGTYIYATENNQTKCFDLKGNIIENAKYKSLITITNENYYITINNEGLYGVADKQENEIIKNKYKYIEYAFEDYFIITNENDKLGVIDSRSNTIIETNNDIIQKVQGSNILQTIILDMNQTKIYSKDMKEVISGNKMNLYKCDNYIKVYEDNKVKYLSLDGKELSNRDLFVENNLFTKEQNGKYGFVDKNGNVKLDYVYDMATELNKYGFAGIKKDGKWGVIDSNGNIILDPTYNLENVIEPDFIGKYYKFSYGQGEVYYIDRTN